MEIDGAIVFAALFGVALLALIAMVAGVELAIRHRKPRVGRCTCGYSTAGLRPASPAVCPECGRPLTPVELRQLSTKQREELSLLLFVGLAAAPIVVGVGVVGGVMLHDELSGEALLFALPFLLPYVVSSLPIMVSGRRSRPRTLAAIGMLPALAIGVFTGGAYVSDRLMPAGDDVFYPYTLYIFSSVFVLLYSLVLSAGLIWGVVIRRRVARAAESGRSAGA